MLRLLSVFALAFALCTPGIARATGTPPCGQTPACPTQASGNIGQGAPSAITLNASNGFAGQNQCTIDVVNTDGAFTGGGLNVVGSTSLQNIAVTPYGSTVSQIGIATAGLYTAQTTGLSQIQVNGQVTGPNPDSSVNVFIYCVYLPGSSSGGSTVSVISSWLVNNAPASSSCVSPAFCIIKGSAGTFHEAISLTLAGATQPAGNCVWYDNASAASGLILYAENGFGAGQYVIFDAAFANGLVLQCAANPGGFGINTEYR